MSVQFSLKVISNFRHWLSPLKVWYYSLLPPKKLADKDYKKFMHSDKGINWNNPHDLIEKIYWLQLYTDTSLWTLCADKYNVRFFLKERGCSKYLNELFGVWTSEKEIDWNKLPSSFVLKVNNGCGDTILVKDKSKINTEEIKAILHRNLKIKYGYSNAQIHYTHIKPCIIAEKLLENQDNPNESMVDYKIWCINGEPKFILVVSNRTKAGYHLNVFDLKWNNINHLAFDKTSKHYSPINISRPQSLNEMINVAGKLANGFPQVRIDFYEYDNKPIFGEMTFTTGYGYWTREFYNNIGDMIDISKIETMSKINRVAKYRIFSRKYEESK